MWLEETNKTLIVAGSAIVVGGLLVAVGLLSLHWMFS